ASAWSYPRWMVAISTKPSAPMLARPFCPSHSSQTRSDLSVLKHGRGGSRASLLAVACGDKVQPMSDRRAAKVFFPLLVPVLVASGPACSTGNDGADSDGSGSTASASGGGELGAGGNPIGGSNSGGANGGAAAGGQQSSGGASGGSTSGGSAAGGVASGGSAAGGAATGGSAPACESAADAGPAPSADAVSVVDPNQRYQTT